MKRLVIITLAATALALVVSSPGYAFRGGWHGGHFGHGGYGRFGVVIGPGWGPWWGWPYYPYYPYYPYDPYYYSPSPVIIQQEPETYIQKPQQREEPTYWYFCKDPKGYYPYVKRCPNGWLKVVPPSEPSGEEE